MGRSSSVYSAYSRVRSIPLTRPSELTISVTTRPQPPFLLTNRRKALSVIPAIGATAHGDGNSTDPMRTLEFSDICGVHLNADSAADEIHGQHESCVRPFPQQLADHAFQRAVNDFDLC